MLVELVQEIGMPIPRRGKGRDDQYAMDLNFWFANIARFYAQMTTAEHGFGPMTYEGRATDDDGSIVLLYTATVDDRQRTFVTFPPPIHLTVGFEREDLSDPEDN
jgi:hypothetical protein